MVGLQITRASKHEWFFFVKKIGTHNFNSLETRNDGRWKIFLKEEKANAFRIYSEVLAKIDYNEKNDQNISFNR